MRLSLMMPLLAASGAFSIIVSKTPTSLPMLWGSNEKMKKKRKKRKKRTQRSPGSGKKSVRKLMIRRKEIPGLKR